MTRKVEVQKIHYFRNKEGLCVKKGDERREVRKTGGWRGVRREVRSEERRKKKEERRKLTIEE